MCEHPKNLNRGSIRIRATITCGRRTLSLEAVVEQAVTPYLRLIQEQMTHLETLALVVDTGRVITAPVTTRTLMEAPDHD